jgi:hypothetical protein
MTTANAKNPRVHMEMIRLTVPSVVATRSAQTGSLSAQR